MADRVLVAYDGSSQSVKALDHAIEEYPEATLVALTVIDPAEAAYTADETGSVITEGWYTTAETTAERTLDDARERAKGREIETEHVVGRPGRAIIEYVEENDIDGIVMGSHGRTGVSRLLLGSVAETVVRRSPVPVTVVR